MDEDQLLNIADELFGTNFHMSKLRYWNRYNSIRREHESYVDRLVCAGMISVTYKSTYYIKAKLTTETLVKLEERQKMLESVKTL